MSSKVVQMPRVHLTQKVVEKAVAAGAATELVDDRRNGLVLRILKSGTWSWQYRRTIRSTDYRRILGADWTLEENRLVRAVARKRQS